LRLRPLCGFFPASRCWDHWTSRGGYRHILESVENPQAPTGSEGSIGSSWAESPDLATDRCVPTGPAPFGINAKLPAYRSSSSSGEAELPRPVAVSWMAELGMKCPAGPQASLWRKHLHLLHRSLPVRLKLSLVPGFCADAALCAQFLHRRAHMLLPG
jgi:hypothetical protein